MSEYIEREAAIKCAEESYKMWNLTMAAADSEREINKCYKMQELCKAIGEVFKIVPAADVAPVVHGHWCKELVPFRDKLGNQHFGSCCSKCGGIFDRTKFCGGCGAKMDER